MVPDQRRATILRAAGDLFSRHPYADVSVADIAAAAAVSPPLIVFYFGTKRALYLAILATAADAIRAGLADLAGPPSLDRLRAGVRFYADYALAQLETLIRKFESEAEPYRSLNLPMWTNRYGSYDDLARIKEWSAAGGLGLPEW